MNFLDRCRVNCFYGGICVGGNRCICKLGYEGNMCERGKLLFIL